MKQNCARLGRVKAASRLVCLGAMLVTAIVGWSGLVMGQDLSKRVVVGYQGWFTCPNDPGANGFGHWLAGDQPTVEMLPDVSEFPTADTCQLKLPGGTVRVYSSANPNVIDHHFTWMQHYGLDTAAVQRFTSVVKSTPRRTFADTVLFRVRHAAEAHGRSFFVEYDLSGSTPADTAALLADWLALGKAGLSQSPAYQRQDGHPLVGFFGLGFGSRPWGPADGAALIRAFKAAPGGAAVMLGLPAWWRTGTHDASPDPAWLQTYKLADVLSPWTVGRFANAKGAKAFAMTVMAPDVAWSETAKLTYMPVAFPGFSWSNLKPGSPRNEIPRDGGAFFRQQFDDMKALGVQTVYIAMFDEVDEGTAIFKLTPHAAGGRNGSAFMALDADGLDLPPDFYLRVAQSSTAYLKRQAFSK